MGEVAISFNRRTYRFACGDSEIKRLEDVAEYLKVKLDELMQEHGPVGDERLMLMAALVVADELFDARADLEELLEGNTDGASEDDGDSATASASAKLGGK